MHARRGDLSHYCTPSSVTRLLLNENVPLTSIRILKAQGYDAVAVAEVAPGAPDAWVLQFAHRQRRILVTFDRDYGELVFRRNLPHPTGLIYLRFAPATPDEPAHFLHELLQRKDLHCEGKFTVADREQIRQRPLNP